MEGLRVTSSLSNIDITNKIWCNLKFVPLCPEDDYTIINYCFYNFNFIMVYNFKVEKL